MFQGSTSYDARSIAAWILFRAAQDDLHICSLKLEFLVYLAHAHYVTVTNKALIWDPVDTDAIGPSIRPIVLTFPDGSELAAQAVQQHFVSLDERVLKFMEKIYDAYGHMCLTEITALVSKEGGPWHSATGRDGYWTTISVDLIRKTFKRTVRRNLSV